MIPNFMYALIRPCLFSMDPENAHHFTLSSMRMATAMGINALAPAIISSPRKVMGLTFPNPVGLAAGLDKNGSCIDGLASLGFGFLELGTVTPRPQPGNPKPRMFRLPDAEGLINRMGFNNDGVDVLVKNVKASRFYREKKGILGLNIGKNAVTPIEKAVDDYLICLEKVYPVADYIAINISSPNTKNLRQLQGESELDNLLTQLKAAQDRLSHQYSRYVPLALKIAPDIDDNQIRNIADALIRHKIDGVIATNTTITRDAVKHLKHGQETGGLSGAPVRDLSTHVIRQLKAELGDTVPIIGVGGILTGEDAKNKIEAGASLIQILTGMIYSGPGLVRECAQALRQA